MDKNNQVLSMHSLARYNSWNVGGKAKLFYKPSTLLDCIDFIQSLPIDETIVWLGLGSNILFPDGVLDAVVINTRDAFKNCEYLGGSSFLVQAGVTCSKFAKFVAGYDINTSAFFAGIPGTVGGALAMNAGAFGGETWSYVQSVVILGRDGGLTNYSQADFVVGYRNVQGPDGLFVAANFDFSAPGLLGEDVLNIKDLLKRRNQTQPIGTWNCGSVFRNPENDYAARLIESLGLKGYSIGDAQISDVHANFIINKGKATAKDIKALIAFIEEQVFINYNIKLEKEVVVL